MKNNYQNKQSHRKLLCKSCLLLYLVYDVISGKFPVCMKKHTVPSIIAILISYDNLRLQIYSLMVLEPRSLGLVGLLLLLGEGGQESSERKQCVSPIGGSHCVVELSSSKAFSIL